MAERRKRSKHYLRIVAGASAVLRLMLLVLAVVILIFIGRSAYSVGYNLFQEDAEQSDGGDTFMPDFLSGIVDRFIN